MIDEIFKFKSANVDKLKKFGFKLNGETYEYKTDILNGEFELCVYISIDGKIKTKVVDKQTEDEYILHLTQTAVGEFVGKVRTEFKEVLQTICAKCFEKDVFKSMQSKEVIAYVQNKYGDELEFLWEKFDNNAIWRRKDNKKWYAIMIVLPRRRIGINSDEIVEIIDLRADPEQIEKMIDNKGIFAGYHMNKKHWITICLDGTMPTKTICNYIDASYALAKK